MSTFLMLSSFDADHLDDTIGMAVDLWSEVTVERADVFEITAEGDGAESMPKDDSNFLVVGCKAAFETANKPMPILKYHVVSRIPYARGLGSSSAAIVAGIIAGLILAGHRLPCWGSEALLQIAAEIEVRPAQEHEGAKSLLE
jgi:homoserine kinase